MNTNTAQNDAPRSIAIQGWQAIADALGVSIPTVKTHIRRYPRLAAIIKWQGRKPIASRAKIEAYVSALPRAASRTKVAQ